MYQFKKVNSNRYGTTFKLLNPIIFTLNNTKTIFGIEDTYKFGRYILISTFVSVGTVIVTLLFAIPAAYAVARLNFFGKNFLSTSILIIYMFLSML